MNKYEKVAELLESMFEWELLGVYNDYCDYAGYCDDRIYSMDEFDELMSGQTPWEIARTAYYGDFCPAHDYFWFNGYGNLESDDFVSGKIDISEMAQYIVDNENDLNHPGIAEILEEEGE